MRLLGLKTAVLDEMGETLQLITALMEVASCSAQAGQRMRIASASKALEEEFVEFLPDTCRQLLETESVSSSSRSLEEI